MSYALHKTLTPARRQWLERVRDNGTAKRSGRGPVGYQCMHLGWTEWDFRTPEGEPISPEAAKARYGEMWFQTVANNWQERITDEGRKMLAEPEIGARRGGGQS